MKIRKMQKKDINSVYQLGIKEKEFQVSEDLKFWSKNQIKNWIISKDGVLLVAEQNKDIVGFIMSTIHNPTKKAVIENIYISKKYRSKGLAEKLLNMCIKLLKKQGAIHVHALVEDSNKASLNLLKKNNFNIFSKFYWVYKVNI